MNKDQDRILHQIQNLLDNKISRFLIKYPNYANDLYNLPQPK